ncbi:MULTISPECIES: Pycsar system effector family protein [unclassified Aeromicrobium]|uniref:Pycsar system effector family protein n=1 Tax=unclassified Aeromicrobium TaxID=2633570 RepID=UPI00288925E9|nr:MULTISPECIES: Pycsar system effector family protein [unclassified Aeromicrobium]
MTDATDDVSRRPTTGDAPSPAPEPEPADVTAPDHDRAVGAGPLEVELSILAEARNEVGAADHKASMVLAVLGIGFGALLAGLLARDWSPAELEPFGRVVWTVGALLAGGSVGAAACAVWPRFTVPPPSAHVYYWGHVAAFASRDDLDETLDAHPPTLPARTRHQLYELSRIVARKYHWVRVAMRLAGASVPFFLLAAFTGY